MRKILFACLALFAFTGGAYAGQILFWDFNNPATVGSISTFQATSFDPLVSGFASQTGGGPAENFGGSWGWVDLTRFLGTYHPFITFSTAETLSISDLTFQHVDNHNPGFPTSPQYDVQLQLDSGSGFVDIGSPLTLDVAHGLGGWATMTVNLMLAPGTYTIRWDPRNLAYGTDTNTEFLALHDLSLNGTAVPEPASLLLVAATGLMLLIARALRASAGRGTTH